ncbi:MAG TPA: ABC transporter permease, partial [Candidatus Glassbacteria bacterium]|nr:ABC transporter permease [Candidatus Glassbacteria bacterium]
LMGLISGVLAIPLGLVMAVVLIDVINRRSFGWSMELLLEPRYLAGALLLGLLAGLLAGVYPAWRMARIAPASALRDE